MLTTVAPLGSNIDGTGESPRSARVADQNGPISKTLIFAPRYARFGSILQSRNVRYLRISLKKSVSHCRWDGGVIP